MNRSWSPAENVSTTVHSRVAIAPSIERQAGRARVPGGPAERVATRFDRRAGEAIGQRLLVLRQDVDGIPAGGPDDRGQEAATIQGDHHQRRVERDRAQGVDRDPERLLAVERADDRDAGHEMAHDPAERVGSDDVDGAHGRSLECARTIGP